MARIKEIEEGIVEEFSYYDDWMGKYECQSRVWLYAELEGDKIMFTADSDAIITKGIIGLLIRVLSNQTPDDIINTDLSFIDRIGLKEHLSPTRSNGLVSMIKQMKLYALALKTKML